MVAALILADAYRKTLVQWTSRYARRVLRGLTTLPIYGVVLKNPGCFIPYG
jgi:hypothetical protein